jgi:shikimate kinase
MIYLIGYMGCGKSTIGPLLSSALSLPFTDTDTEIEKENQQTITELFKKDGELHFRKLETALLYKLTDAQIVACGGGLPLFNNNMDYITKSGSSVYLKASANFLFMRLKNEKKTRPLINKLDDKQLQQFIHTQLSKRENTYSKATYIVRVEDKTPAEILGEIHALLLPC